MKKSLKFRLLTWGCGSILGVATGLSIYSSLTLKEELFEKAKIQSEEISSSIAGNIEKSILTAKESTVTMSKVLGQLNEKNSFKLERTQMVEILEKQLKSDSGFFGTYVLFEPNAFDKRDSELVNAPCHDEEVGKLAEMSGASAKDINALLDQSSRNVEAIIHKMQERINHMSKTGKIKIEEGVRVADQCGKLLDEIVEGADRVKAMMVELADANGQQSEGIKNITDAMGMLQTTTQANNNNVNLMANNTERLFKETVVLADNTVELKKEVFGTKAA